MIINLNDKWNTPISTFNIKGIGECYLYPLNVHDETTFNKIYPKSKNEYSSDQLANYTLRFILKKSKEGKGPYLSEEEVVLIPTEIREEIFEKLLERSSYLYKETKRTTEKNSEGEKVIKFKEGEILYPRNEGETATQYYHRVKYLNEEKQAKRYKDMYKELNFSMGLNEQILKSMKNLEDITRPLKNVEHLVSPLKNLENIVSPLKKMEQAIKPIKLPISDVMKSINDSLKPNSETINKSHHFDFKIPENPQVIATKKMRQEMNRNHSQSMVIFANISESLIGMLNELQGSTKEANKSLRIALISLIATVIIGILQLYIDITNSNIEEIKIELQKSYRTQEKLVERIESLEHQRSENERKILKELMKLKTPQQKPQNLAQ